MSTRAVPASSAGLMGCCLALPPSRLCKKADMLLVESAYGLPEKQWLAAVVRIEGEGDNKLCGCWSFKAFSWRSLAFNGMMEHICICSILITSQRVHWNDPKTMA